MERVMKLVHFADLHLDAAFVWAATAASRRRDALRQALRRVLDLAAELRVDAILCGGDLYEHDRVTPDTQAFLRAEFARLAPVRIFIAPGNHDWFGPQSLYAQAEWPSNVHVFKNAVLEPVVLGDGITLWGAAHRSPAVSQGFLDNFAVDRGGIHVGLFHGSERSWFAEQGDGKMAHAPFGVEQIAEAGLHHALLGHYHRPRDAATHTYPGNPEPLSFGEDGERGAVLLTIAPDGSITLTRHRVAGSILHDLNVDVTGCTNRQDVRDQVAASLTGLQGIARVTLNGELVPEIDLSGLEWTSLAHSLDVPPLVRVGQIRVGYDFEAISREPTVRGEFVRHVLQSELPERRRQQVLITGLRALDGRDDLEVF